MPPAAVLTAASAGLSNAALLLLPDRKDLISLGHCLSMQVALGRRKRQNVIASAGSNLDWFFSALLSTATTTVVPQNSLPMVACTYAP